MVGARTACAPKQQTVGCMAWTARVQAGRRVHVGTNGRRTGRGEGDQAMATQGAAQAQVRGADRPISVFWEGQLGADMVNNRVSIHAERRPGSI